MAKPTAKQGSDYNLDAEDMFGAILAWPKRLRTGFGYDVSLPERYRDAKNIVVCAMGGSAIGASLVGNLLEDQLTVPFTVVRDYDLPAAVGPETLVIAVSHSGGTEETLSAYAQAKERGAKLIAITTGGALAKLAAEDEDAAYIEYGCPGEPRAAMPLVLGLLLKVLGVLGYAPDQSKTVEAAAAHLDEIVRDVQNTDDNQSVMLGSALAGRIPIVYGAGFLGEAARRVKGQISENGKQTAAWEILPEQNHNALVGYEFPKDLGDTAVFVLLRANLEHPRHASRFEFMKGLLDRRQLKYVEITGTGPDKLSQMTSVIFWGDLGSYELARRNGVDPTPVEIIKELKQHLAEDDA
jgi:glucose/mannose-6-phosphate isomerase